MNVVKVLQYALVSVVSIGLMACTPPKHYEVIKQQKHVALTAYIGGEIVSLKKSRDLPNAFGGADIFGGKVDGGYIRLSFSGLTNNGYIIVRRQDVEIQSDATTMSRYGVGQAFSNTNLSGTATTMGGVTSYSGSATGHTTYIRPRRETTVVLPPNTIEFEWDYKKNDVLDMGVFRVRVVNVTSTRFDYVIQ
jgi:hypothetical protein